MEVKEVCPVHGEACYLNAADEIRAFNPNGAEALEWMHQETLIQLGDLCQKCKRHIPERPRGGAMQPRWCAACTSAWDEKMDDPVKRW